MPIGIGNTFAIGKTEYCSIQCRVQIENNEDDDERDTKEIAILSIAETLLLLHSSSHSFSGISPVVSGIFSTTDE